MQGVNTKGRPTINPMLPDAAPDFEPANFLNVLGAGFRTENDMYAAWQTINEPDFPEDPAFTSYEHGPSSTLWLTNWESLSRAQSMDEFNFIEQKIVKENEDRALLASNGVGQGLLAGMVAGLVSPTSLIPLTTAAKGAKGMRDAFLLAGAASTAQEAVLYGAQETRTGEEVALGIAGGTVLGGLLGSAAVFLRKGDIARIVDDMAGVPTKGSVQRSATPSTLEALPEDVRVHIQDPETYIPRRTDYVKNVEDFIGKDGAVTLGGVKAMDVPVPVRHMTVKFPEIHEAVRATQPEVFDQFDILLTRRQVLKDYLVEAKAKDTDLDIAEIKADLAEVEELITAKTPEVDKVYVAAKITDPIARIKAKEDYLKGKTTTKEISEAASTSDKSIGAASSGVPVHGLMPAPNRVSTKVANVLANISGVGRTLKQQTSPVARQVMAKFHDAGIFLDTRQDPNLPLSASVNANIRPAAIGGTITHRIDVHETAVAQYVKELDDAYTRYVYDDASDADALKNSSMADVRSGLGTLPDGKMTRGEFDELIFDLQNTGRTSNNPHVQKGLEAVKKGYAYFRKVHDEAFEEVKLQFGEDMRPVIPEDAKLGEGVEEYLNHVYDSRAINESGTGFQDALFDSARAHLTKRYGKELGRLNKARAKLLEEVTKLDTPTRQMTKEIKALDAEIKKLEAKPDFVDGQKYLTELRAQLKAAKATPEETRLAVKEAKDGLGVAYNDIAAKWTEARASKKAWETAKGKPLKSRGAARDKLVKQSEKLDDDFEARWREKGAAGSETTILKGEADFDERALADAQDLQHRIRGNKNRVAGMDIIGAERGPELARTLNMPFDVKKQFLVTNLERLMRIYSRHMAADLEIWRATGSVNGARALDDIKIDLRNAEQAIMNGPTKGKEKAIAAFQKSEKQILEDFSVVISRLRHTRAANMDTDSWTYRLGTLALNLNVVRSMGTVVTSSVSDVGRPVMMFGLTNTFRHGWGQYIQGLIGVNKGVSRAELQNFGIGLDPILHNRAQAVFEMMDVEPGKQVWLEKGAQFLANKTGMVAMFDRWTAEMKFIAGSTAVGTIADAMQLVAKGGTGKRTTWAKTLLADGGLDAGLITRIQKQLNLEGGSQTIGSLQLPNTKAWTDMGAIDAYRQMINKFTNDAIITPGPDRPNWMDASIGHRMLAQFRTFNMTATNRTVIRGLQQSDMAVLNGMMVSLAMGAISYYTWAMTVGGKAKQDMLQGDVEQWSYQAVSRSGLLAALAEPQRIGENVPALQQMKIFGGQTARTRRPTSLMSAIAGPSFDLAERVSGVVMGLDDPTQSTLHQARTLTAYQNVFYIRWLFDQVEKAAGETLNLPEKRGQ